MLWLIFIRNLVMPTAEFSNMSVGGQFENNAGISYSGGALTGKVKITSLPSFPLNQLIVKDEYSPDTFQEGNVISFTYTIKNPNNVSVSDLYFDVGFHSAFTCSNVTITSDKGSTAGRIGHFLDPLSGMLLVANSANSAGFDMQANETLTITFKLTAPANVDALKLVDTSVFPPVLLNEIEDLVVDYAIYVDSGDVCAFRLGDSGIRHIPYKKRQYIITNRPITSPPKIPVVK